MELECSSSREIHPFLKWAGGKQWIAKRIASLVPTDNCTYFEPFLGGGSLFFAAQPSRAVLSDINSRLIEAYITIRRHPVDVIGQLAQWRNTEIDYYRVRSAGYSNLVKRAAQFVYLNKTCWNGLYRVNQKGEFNVPYANNRRQVYSEDSLLLASRALHSAKLICCDFEESLSFASSGDFVYLDPPYTVLHSDNGFRRYNERIFRWEDQIRLALAANSLVDRGCFVIVSNADHAEIIRLYSKFRYLKLERNSLLAANSQRRRKTSEALFLSFNIAGKELSLT